MLGLRAAALFVAGSALVVLPVALGLGAAATVTGAIAGGLAIALAGAGADAGRGGLPLRAQAAYDRGLAIGLLLAALGFAVGNSPQAALLFAAVGAAALAINLATRYTASPGV